MIPSALVLLPLTLLCAAPAAKPDAGVNPPSADGGVACSELSDDAVVATFDGQSVTYREVREHAKDELADLEKKKYDLLDQTLDNVVVEKLVEAEAKKSGMSEEQYLRSQIDAKVQKPSDKQLHDLYDSAKDRLPEGATFDQVKPQLEEYLTGKAKQDRANQLFAELEKKANVKKLLPEPKVERKQVEAVGPSKGPANAPVTIVEFSDFQCPYCGRAKGTVDEVLKKYGNKVRLVFRNYPLSFHPNAEKAAEAAACANDQKKFWPMHDTLFGHQDALSVDQLKRYAADLKLDTAKFNKCLDSGEKAALVKADQTAGEKLGLNGTPAFFINGIVLSGAMPLDEFSKVIDREIASAPH